MKKSLLAFLLALTATFTLAAIGCKDDDNTDMGNQGNVDNSGDNNSPEEGETFEVTLTAGEGYKIVADDVSYNADKNHWTASVEKDSTFTFSIELGAFYTGTPTVTMDGVSLSASEDGKYSVTVTKDCEVSIKDIKKATSKIASTGTGAIDSAYMVREPIDLVYIAEQVNAGKGNYARAYYILENDIDCKGEEISVIGTEEYPFSGCFTCLTDSATSEMTRHTISNFKINATDKNYVGLFGCVQVDMSVTSSGLFYGICIDNFEINASTTNLEKGNRNIYCGGLIGYGLGTRAYLCNATNGTINITADPTEFSFVGGLMGVQQSVYMAEYAQFFNAETAYANVDVDVNVVSGTTLYAGGIAGYLYTNSYLCPSYIHNSYATGNVSGAIRTGGIVGGLGQYSSIATCYSTGNVRADVKLTAETDGYLPEHCIAYAGGIAGFAENDTVVSDCFAVGTISAKAVDGASAQKTSHDIGGGDEDGKISVAARKYIALNCLSSLDKASMATTLKNMGWQSYNWIFPENKYPVINYEASEEQAKVVTTVCYVDKNNVGSFDDKGNWISSLKVRGETTTEYSYTNMYTPIASAFVDGFLDLYATADDKQNLSFGYYFDKECTKPVPYSYISTRNSTLYMGFTNPSEIVGKYALAIDGAKTPLYIELKDNGTALCADGADVLEANYQYDGETLIIEGARLARYFKGAVDKEQSVNEDTLFDMYRYDAYYFQAVKTENGLKLFDGTYFTKDAPLQAYASTEFKKFGAYHVGKIEYVFLPDGTGTKDGQPFTYTYAEGVITIDGNTTINEADLSTYCALQGTWQKSAFSGKTFYFDGIDTWTSYTNVYVRTMGSGSVSSDNKNEISGKFETTDGKTYILKDASNAEYARVTFDEFGALQVIYANGDKESYFAEHSLVGTWKGNGIEVRLHGINANGIGNATATFTRLNVTYDLTYTLSETTSPSAYLCLYYEGFPFGYFAHNEFYNALQATLFDPTSIEGGYVTTWLSLVNDFDNVWISNNTTFDDISFNGVGSFNETGNWQSTVKIGNDTVPYILYNGGTNGYFDYQGQRYSLIYDDVHGQISVNTDITLERKDALAGIDFVSIDSANRVSSFAFDGKSNLTTGGTMTVTLAGEAPATYGYQKTGEDSYVITQGIQAVGSILLNDAKACYDITLNGVSYTTYIRNEFIGSWAMSGEFKNDAFVIGATDLDGYIHASFQGENVKIEKKETDFYSFYCEIEGMPITYYMFALYDYNDNGEKTTFDSFALSEYTSLANGSYILCSLIDPMKGTWVQNDNASFTISFDGVQSAYSNGTATLSYKNNATPYSYRIYKDKNGNVESVMLWSQNTYGLSGKTLYYKLTPCAVTEKGAFVLGDKAYIRTEIDALYKMEATGKDGYTYAFDGSNINDDTLGTITATKNGAPTKTLKYDIVSFNNDNTATITVKGDDNKEMTYILDYSSTERKIYDGLYKLVATDAEGKTYAFDGGNLNNDTLGVIVIDSDDKNTMTYSIVSITETTVENEKQKIAVLTVTQTVDGKTTVYTATVDLSDITAATITLEKQA